MNLPPIRPPSECGTFSTPGYVGLPEAFDHHHDSRYYTEAEADCAMRSPYALIIGDTPPSVCVGCQELAGYAISLVDDVDTVVTLQILSEADPGPGPYGAPIVILPVVTVVGPGTLDVIVMWGPDNNDASISLVAIAEAIANDPIASEFIRIAVCNTDQFIEFNQQLAVQLVRFPAHTHVSSDITDASYGGNGVADGNKLLRFNPLGTITATLSVTAVSANALEKIILQPNSNAGLNKIRFQSGSTTFNGDIAFPLLGSHRTWQFPDKTGNITITVIFSNETSAIAGGVLIGDVWWDTTQNKAKTRLQATSTGGLGILDTGKTVQFGPSGSLTCSYSLTIVNPAIPGSSAILEAGLTTGNRLINIPDLPGMMAVTFEFDDDDTALGSGYGFVHGDVYWNTPSARPRAIISSSYGGNGFTDLDYLAKFGAAGELTVTDFLFIVNGVGGPQCSLNVSNISSSQAIQLPMIVGGGNVLALTPDTNGRIFVDSLIATNAISNASAGKLGEYLETKVNQAGAVTLTSTVNASVASVILTAGDWDVEGHVNFIPTVAATVTLRKAGINPSSAILPTDGSEAYNSRPTAVADTSIETIPLTRKRISIASTTTIYLVANATFGTGGAVMKAFGFISARRVR